MPVKLEDEILQLANLISEVPINSLIDQAAFEPLVMILHSDHLASDLRADDELRTFTIMRLIAFGDAAISPLLSYALYDLNEDQSY